MKRSTWILVIALILSLSLGVGVAKPIELIYWTHTDDNRTEIGNRYINESTKMYPNVKIKRVVNEASKMGDIVLTAFSAHNAPDIFNLPIEQEYGYMVNHRVVPVDYRALGFKNHDELRAQYIKGTFDAVQWTPRDAGLDPVKDCPWKPVAPLDPPCETYTSAHTPSL